MRRLAEELKRVNHQCYEEAGWSFGATDEAKEIWLEYSQATTVN